MEVWCVKHLHLFYRCPLSLDRRKQSSDTLFYFEFTESVYVICTLIKDLKDNTGPFYSYDGGEN